MYIHIYLWSAINFNRMHAGMAFFHSCVCVNEIYPEFSVGSREKFCPLWLWTGVLRVLHVRVCNSFIGFKFILYCEYIILVLNCLKQVSTCRFSISRWACIGRGPGHKTPCWPFCGIRGGTADNTIQNMKYIKDIVHCTICTSNAVQPRWMVQLWTKKKKFHIYRIVLDWSGFSHQFVCIEYKLRIIYIQA